MPLPRSRLSRARLPLLALLAATACDAHETEPWQPHPVSVDFGMIPHGSVKTVRLGIDFPRDRGPMVPLAFRGNCSCASWAFVAVGKGGHERRSLGRPDAEHAVLPGEELFLELSLDTKRKEAATQKPVTSGGDVLLTDLGDKVGRVAIPVAFTYGIEAPVELSPFAHVDFGALPMSRRYSVTLELRPRAKPRVAFGPVRSDDPRVTAQLRQEGDLTVLDVRVVPDRAHGLGVLAATVSVSTDLDDGYIVPIPVTGQFVDDVEIRPMERISFGRLDLTKPQTGEVILRDHDLGRSPEFVVLGIRSVVGKGLAQHFSVELVPIPGDDRSTRLTLRYKGTYSGSRAFRGFVDLGKSGVEGSVASLEFVGFGND